jgi:bifunctional non-homologous end joining protein LigD
VSFLRYPDGPDGEVFFTKNVPPGTPEWVTTAEVPRAEGPARMVLVQDLASLMWAANLVTEFHTPQWVIGAPGEADRLVFDLDPGPPATVVHACEVALWLRERLAADGIEAYAKTSGAKGLHLLAAVRGASSQRASEYAKALAVEAERALPRLVVHRMTRSLRPGKVFVDWSQNAARKTTATPYTVRARAEPTVSAPVTWTEVEACREPADLVFRAQDMGPRLQDLGDLMAPLLDAEHAGTLP